MNGKGPYLYACLDCSKTFEDKELKMKDGGMKCPNCGAPAYYVMEKKKLREEIHDHLWILYFLIGLMVFLVVLFVLAVPKNPLLVVMIMTLMALVVWFSYNNFQRKKQVYKVAYGKKKDSTVKE